MTAVRPSASVGNAARFRRSKAALQSSVQIVYQLSHGEPQLP